jgi:hypothetical protein
MPKDYRGDQNARFAAVLGMLDLNDAKVAARLEVGRTFLVRLRTRSSGISRRLANAMETEFGVQAAWLLTGKGPVFPGRPPEAGVERGIVALLNPQSDPAGAVVFVGAADYIIDVGQSSGATPGSIWKCDGKYGRRPVTPTIARWKRCFYILPDNDDIHFLGCSNLEILLFAEPSAYFQPRHVRIGDVLTLLAVVGDRPSLLKSCKVLSASRCEPGNKGTDGITVKATPGKACHFSHYGEFRGCLYRYDLEGMPQRRLKGQLKIRGVGVRAERGLMQRGPALKWK